jgi:hypothetical protein
MEMAVRLMETAVTVMESNGDGSGGTSPSWQGAGTETSVPQNFSSTVTALQNCYGKNADHLRVFLRKALYRRRGGVRGWTTWPHHGVARPGAGPRPPVVSAAPIPPPSHLRSS